MSASQEDSIQLARDRHRGELGELIAETIERSGTELSAPALLDLILWNVVIAYFVSLSANASYALIKGKLAKKGRIDQGDLAEVSTELVEPTPIVTAPPADTVDRVAAVLIEFKVAESVAKEMAEKIMQTLLPPLPS
jgi:hypothetical protein